MIRFSNRVDECRLFREILEGNSSLHGIVIHSNGEGGMGKTTLLSMFKGECKLKSIPVISFAKRSVNWHDILKNTVLQLGNDNFPTFLKLSNEFSNFSPDSNQNIGPIIHK